MKWNYQYEYKLIEMILELQDQFGWWCNEYLRACYHRVKHHISYIMYYDTMYHA